MKPTSHITLLLQNYTNGDKASLDPLLEAVYAELKILARSYMRRESPSHTLQPTALVHEAFFKLVDQNNVEWQNRAHFFGIAAQLMRRILIDHARAKGAEKRGGSKIILSFDEKFHDHSDPRNTEEALQPDLLQLDTAMKKLESFDPRQAKMVELRFFGGLSIEDTAEVLQISIATVKRDWVIAKAWLYRELASARIE